jgi:multimeric flavodoxin WrbA
MSTAVVYYSYSGHTREYATKLAAELNAADPDDGTDLIELTPHKPISKIAAYASGCTAAMSCKSWPTAKDPDLSEYKKVIFCSPIWAGNISPYINYAIEFLPRGIKVEFRLISSKGKNSCRERLSETVGIRGCTLGGVQDVKA